MSRLVVALAADHAGFELKNKLRRRIEELGYAVLDLGTDNGEAVDYPDFGRALADAVAEGRADRGIAVCGTGIGIGIAANRNPRIRAAVCHDALTTRLSRQHNDANVLALGARIIGEEVAKDCVEVFLSTAYEGGRHARRIAKLS